MVSDYPGINGAPAWSPDSKKLALVLSKSGNPKIYVLNLETNQLTQITHGWSLDTEPSWAPDGQSLIFTSSREGGPQIYQIKLGTQKATRITYQGNYNARASFTPNGKNIVMLHGDGNLFTIAIQNLTTGQVRELTSPGLDESPSVAPNGQMVVYATTQSNHGVIAMVSTNGQVKLNLPMQSANVQEPAWSPFLKT